MRRITATAPAKAILFGEHAVNRGQPALAMSVGLYATCALAWEPRAAQHIHERAPEDQTQESYRFASDGRSDTTTRSAILDLGRAIDTYRDDGDYAAIQRIAAEDFFAPAKYVLAALGGTLPQNLDIRFTSEIPQSAGLGSGGASFAALAAALAHVLGQHAAPHQIAACAQRGDIVAHGGVASGLDTQTSLYGGAIRYTAEQQGEPNAYADGLTLVVGNTGVFAATSDVNRRVRAWLAERPVRMHYFQEIGLLAHQAEAALRDGAWPTLGRLLNLNQLILERIGVSCPELDTLIDAALAVGALGAKLSGSGGGGIMIALTTPDKIAPIAQAIGEAGGTAIIAPIGVPGVQVQSEEQPYYAR
jgi:mevalonate kinase